MLRETLKQQDPIKSQFPIKTSISMWYKCNKLLVLLLLVVSVRQIRSASVTVTSASALVGVMTNYSVTITNHTNPRIIRTQFSTWSPWQSQPYGNSYQYYLTSGTYSSTLLSCTVKFSGTTIQCGLPLGLGTTIQLLMTNINNPSSTKPYPITFILLFADGTEQSKISQLTVTNISTFPLSISSYNSTVGAVSSTNWILAFDYYFSFNTILSIKYNPSLITISFSGLIGATTTSSTSGGVTTVLLSNWTSTTRGNRIMGTIAITNPLASISATLAGLLYFIDSANTSVSYNIQAYTSTLSITPALFTSLSATSSLQLGLSAQLFSVSTHTCPYAPIDKSVANSTLNTTANSSYTQISYYTYDFISSTCTTSTTSTSTSIKTCTFTTSVLPKSITSITQTITSQSTNPINITVYTYFGALANYYPLCSQTYSLPLAKQVLSVSTIVFNTAGCGTGKTGQLNNNTVLGIRVEGAATGDIVTIYSLQGVVYNNWQKVNTTNTSSTANNYRYTLTSANIINSTYISIPLQYYNPTYLTSANKLTNITLSRIESSIQYIYAIIPYSTNTSSTTIQLCTVGTASQLQSFTYALSSYQTYGVNVTATITFKNKIRDYSPSDYIRVWYKYYDGTIFMTLPSISSSIKSTLSTNTTTTNNSISVINNTIVHIFNISQINNISTSVNTLTIYGLPNPATIYPIVLASNAYHIAISLMSSNGIEKEQYVVKFTSNTTQTAYTYLSSTISVVQSMQLGILVNMSSMVLSLSNSNKYKYYSNLSQSTLTIKLPFTCAQTNTNGTVTSAPLTKWSPFISPFNITLTNCNIPYLNSSTSMATITQQIPIDNSTTAYSISTTTTYYIVLNCADNCQLCTDNNICTLCVNSTYTLYNLLYSGICYSTCPSRTYRPANRSVCQLCHPSCLSCSGSQLHQCLTCPQFYISRSINISSTQGVTNIQTICVSVCGQNMYNNPTTNKCQQCQIDCLYCTSPSYCYVCKDGASMVGYGQCDFVLCADPCKSCQGNVTNCTSCMGQKYLYENVCYDKCPTNTYGTTNTTNDKIINVCIQLNVPTLYFPAIICSIVLIALVCVCNTCIDRGLTADSNRKSINMLTYASSILAYMELFALFILLAFTKTRSAVGLGVSGLLIWIICNVLFAVYYCKVLRDDNAIMAVVAKMSSKSKCIYYTVLGLSMGVTLRTYRVLYCGLFRGVAPYAVKKKEKVVEQKQKQKQKQRKGSQAKIANQDINFKIQSSIEQPQPQQQSPKTKTKAASNQIEKPLNKQSITNINTNNGKNTSMSNKTVLKNEVPPLSPKKITFQQPNQIQTNINQQQQNSSMQSVQQHSKFQLKRPHIIYITVGSLVGSVLFLVAGVIQIIGNQYPAMLFWGLDLLIVVIASIIVTALDMWAGIKKSYLMALEKGDANQTMENLRGEDDIDELTQQKILHNTKATQKISKRNSPMKKPSNVEAKPIKKKYVPPVSLRKKSKSPKPQQNVLSPQEKQAQQKANKLKKIKSRYADLYKRNKKPEQQSQSQQNNDQLPDIKVFEDIEMYANDDIEHANKKAKKIKGDHKRMSSMNSMRRANDRSNLNQSSNLTIGKNAKLNWKMDDIFLGFKQNEDDQTQFDKKTIKMFANKPERQTINRRFDKSDGSQEGEQSYIQQLQKQKKQNEKNLKVQNVQEVDNRQVGEQQKQQQNQELEQLQDQQNVQRKKK